MDRLAVKIAPILLSSAGGTALQTRAVPMAGWLIPGVELRLSSSLVDQTKPLRLDVDVFFHEYMI